MRNAAEITLFVCLLAFLAWVPMPFGSASDASQPFLILPPLLICAGAALLRSSSKRPFIPTRPARIWIIGGVLFALVIALQLVPLPMPVLRVFSPRSAEIWASASRVAALAGVHAPALHPITIDPDETALHLYRVLAYFATFLSSLILVRDKARRTLLAALLAAVAVFEALYAVREAALGRYAIWGWKNTLIYGRASGTFVNPNHFAHYAAILLPIALYLSAYAWHSAAPPGALFGRRFVRMMERQFAPFAAGLLAALACIAAVLVSESRGALLAIIGGFAITAAIASDTRRALLRGTLIAVAVAAVIGAAVVVLGHSETVKRFEGSHVSQLESRGQSIFGALRIWKMFPLFGSGSGTRFGKPFDDIVAALQKGSTSSSDADRKAAYKEANNLIKQHVPMVMVAHGGSGVAFKADVEGAHTSPVSSEVFAVMKAADRDTLVWMQNAEPLSLFCADESDGETLRACEQIFEPLYSYKPGGTETIPALATECKASTDLKTWTCTLRDGVKFQDGSTLDANDVVLSYALQWDTKHPLHVGNLGTFDYFPGLFGGFLNPPAG